MTFFTPPWTLALPSLVSLAAYGLAWSLAVGWALAVGLTAARRRRSVATAEPRGVTILKTLCGADEELEKNLRSFFDSKHEPLQIVFGAADPGDPAHGKRPHIRDLVGEPAGQAGSGGGGDRCSHDGRPLLRAALLAGCFGSAGQGT